MSLLNQVNSLNRSNLDKRNAVANTPRLGDSSMRRIPPGTGPFVQEVGKLLATELAAWGVIEGGKSIVEGIANKINGGDEKAAAPPSGAVKDEVPAKADVPHGQRVVPRPIPIPVPVPSKSSSPGGKIDPGTAVELLSKYRNRPLRNGRRVTIKKTF